VSPGSDSGPEAKRLLADNNESPELLILMGRTELEKGNLIDSEKYFQTCIDKTPDYADCYFELSTVMEAQKDDFGHQWALGKAFELAPFDREIRISYARRLMDKEEFDKSLAVLSHPIFAANDPEVAFLRGIIAKEKGDYTKAEELLLFAQKYAYSIEIESQFADLEVRRGQFQQAEQRLEKIESITPGHWETALVKAKLYESTGRIELVPSVLSVFLTTADGGGRVHLTLSNAYARTGNIKKSIEVLEQGIKTWSRHLELTQALTFYLGLTEQYSRAIELLEDLQTFKHKYNELFYHRLRLYYYKAGMMKRFKEYRDPVSIINQ
jgi:tetratricopeptide (TPR) repeat protein